MDVHVARRLWFVRKMQAATVLLLLILFLTGCVPTRPNDLPLYISPTEDGVSFRWCGEEIEDVKRVEVTYATLRPKREDHKAGEWVGHFSLSPGGNFWSLSPPEGAAYQKNLDIPDDVGPILIFVYISLADPSDYMPTVIYEIREPLMDLSGEWIGPAGVGGALECPARS